MLHHTTYLLKYLSGLLLVLVSMAQAQAQAEEETSYYRSYPEHLTTRFYFSRSYTAFRINDKTEQALYTYRPNTTLNMGLGATYKWATLNLAYGFGFLNPESDRGKTRYLDLQTHAYPRKMVIDLFGQFYKGYYLAPGGKSVSPDERYYIRPDLRVIKLGASAQYVFNHERFSYRASFLQNEWQQKSAGTFLAGFEMYGGDTKADSALVPRQAIQDPTRNFRRLHFFEFGPNAGYAYTLVIKRHLFFTASASANLGLGYTTLERDAGNTTNWRVNPNFFFRGFAGYNSEHWSVSASYTHNNVRLARVDDFANSLMTGNYRINFVYRFLPAPGLQRVLRRLDRTK